MALEWTGSARADLVRLYGFLHSADVSAGVRVVRQLVASAKRIPACPRLGVRLTEFESREVRILLVGDYEIRHEVADADIFILRIFHTREDR